MNPKQPDDSNAETANPSGEASPPVTGSAKPCPKPCPKCHVPMQEAAWSAIERLLNGVLTTADPILQCPKCGGKFVSPNGKLSDAGGKL